MDAKKFSKLPKWAYEEFRNLRRRLEIAETALKAIKGDHAQSNTLVEPYASKETESFYLPNNTCVEFRGDNYRGKNWDSEVVRVNKHHAMNVVRVDIGTSGIIIPEARNVINITWVKP